ncbi:ferritin-like domain-containing protein [Kaistella flava (ex Peng et al. 2021)]|uniref:Ferritin-like domain-containing protein n=1 Tax=Kaistella flava (ex Peng et al. 2021) TaxID=2038776 RepID=A0A7M2YD01_9FLAO|nr:ferritin-like domain-containing protein [Kaistella flava (ex Peng et al. 2021)]QOW11679.1 ferritin-like domain-containing protein [Kaistella flava (ex Peng et al. 2021)]
MDTKKSKSSEKKTVAKNLKEFFIDGLKDIYWAENALVKTLPKMFDHATDQKLKTAIKDHLAQTKEHVVRLENVFKSMGLKAEGKKCLAMDGIIKEGDEIIEETAEGPVRDAGIIASAQKVEHYEIATYGTLAAFAKTLNEREALDLLLKTLGEEKKSDCLLSTIADTNLNSQAVDGKLQSKDLNAV